MRVQGHLEETILGTSVYIAPSKYIAAYRIKEAVSDGDHETDCEPSIA
jgi:hypothetical protein